MKLAGRALLVVAITFALAPTTRADDEPANAPAPAAGESASGGGGATLAPGATLGQDNWQSAENLLPPEILKHYREGGFKNKIVAWPAKSFRWETAFEEATLTNRGKYDVNDAGTIIDKSTGKQPPYVYGFPFPDVDAKDPKAAAKILWNSYYGYWYLGNSHNDVRVVWVNPDGVDREAGQDVFFMYYDGQSEPYRVPNPQNLLMQFIATATYPTDLQGTTALSWRYRDPDKRDSNWAYVPSLRRTRAVSPSNRSDGFLGSDLSQDDGPFFDGKPEDFEWKLIGSTDQLRYADPMSLEGKSEVRWLPGGGWRTIWDKNLPAAGFQDPNWKGIAWAPVGPQLAKRPMWVLEATPKDKYYLYGKVQLFIDKETYQGAFNRKFNWQGDLMNTYLIMGFLSHKHVRPDGREDWLWGSNMGYQTAENIKMNRATVSGLEAPSKDVANDRRIPYDPAFFDFNTLQRFGK
ncbi:MAG TPA: outer membrane lipoprotein-sorting protein [Candidatus Binatia bacterium]|nr:outer membrane lipoprotein-sorting protein [Candidatus Binatia bacterium]